MLSRAIISVALALLYRRTADFRLCPHSSAKIRLIVAGAKTEPGVLIKPRQPQPPHHDLPVGHSVRLPTSTFFSFQLTTFGTLNKQVLLLTVRLLPRSLKVSTDDPHSS